MNHSNSYLYYNTVTKFAIRNVFFSSCSKTNTNK